MASSLNGPTCDSARTRTLQTGVEYRMADTALHGEELSRRTGDQRRSGVVDRRLFGDVVRKKQRTPLLKKFTPMESLVVAFLSRGEAYRMIAKRLSVSTATVRFHLANAARKIPGDLEVRIKILFWCRGATLDQLTGEGWEAVPPNR